MGLYSHQPVSQIIYEGLFALQHRGQDSAGIATCENRIFYLHKNSGLLARVFDQDKLMNLVGNVGIGHVRYPTAGGASFIEAQPFYVNSPYGIVLSHNGTLTNGAEVKKKLSEECARHVNTSSDSEVLLNVFAHALSECTSAVVGAADIFYAVKKVHEICKGGYAVVAIVSGVGLVAFRDPDGIRSLTYGTHTDEGKVSHMFASESVAFDVNDFTLEGDVLPGQAIFIDNDGGVHRGLCSLVQPARPCLFEYVYLSRPDSIVNNVPVCQSRGKMGVALAHKIKKEWPTYQEDIDVIIAVPETSRIAALEMAWELNIPFREGFVKNTYVGRTFIMPTQTIRRHAVRQKLNTIAFEFTGKKVLLVDDSIVRGVTSLNIIKMIKKLGVAEIYLASTSPEVRFPNVYGIDMPSKSELIAHNKSHDEICAQLGCDRLVYQNLEDLKQCITDINPELVEFEDSVFSGHYIAGNINEDYLDQLEKRKTNTHQKTEGSFVLHNIEIDRAPK